jgi:hypothetical protein
MSEESSMLSNLIQQVSKDIRRDIFCSCVVFPRTGSITANKPLKTIDIQDSKVINFDEIINMVQNEPDFVVVSARIDLELVLTVLKDVSGELLLDKMDKIQIYKGGIDLLTIDRGTKDGCTAYVEINDYRRRLQNLLLSRPVIDSYQNALFSLASMTVIAVGISYIYSVIRK